MVLSLQRTQRTQSVESTVAPLARAALHGRGPTVALLQRRPSPLSPDVDRTRIDRAQLENEQPTFQRAEGASEREAVRAARAAAATARARRCRETNAARAEPGRTSQAPALFHASGLRARELSLATVSTRRGRAQALRGRHDIASGCPREYLSHDLRVVLAGARRSSRVLGPPLTGREADHLEPTGRSI